MKKLNKMVAMLVVLGVLCSISLSIEATSGKIQGKKLININTAQLDELTELPRIGKKIGQRIIDFRKKHGKFKRIEDLMKVKGIGEKTFNRFKSRLKV